MKYLNDNALNYLISKIDKVKHFWNNEERGTYKDTSNKESLDVLFKSNDAKPAKNNTIIARSLMVGKGDNQVLDVRNNSIKIFRNQGINYTGITDNPIIKIDPSHTYDTIDINRSVYIHPSNKLHIGSDNILEEDGMNAEKHLGLKFLNRYTNTVNNKTYQSGMILNNRTHENNTYLFLSPQMYYNSSYSWNRSAVISMKYPYNEEYSTHSGEIALYTKMGSDSDCFLEMNVGNGDNTTLRAGGYLQLVSDGRIFIGSGANDNSGSITIGNSKRFFVENAGVTRFQHNDIYITHNIDNFYINSSYAIFSSNTRVNIYGDLYVGTYNNINTAIHTNNLYLKNKIDQGYTNTEINNWIDEGLLSNLYDIKTNIDYIEDDTQSSITVEGNLVHIEDAAPINVESCITTLEPIQDLHGYSKPWVGGANKNILKNGETSPISNKGFTATMNSDGSWDIGGGNTESFFSTIYSNLPINFPAGTYTFSTSCSSEAVINELQVWIYTKIDGAEDATATRLAIPANVTFTASSSFSITNIAFWHDNANKSFSGKVFMQLEQASSPTAWTPYSNICPINGHTGVELTRTGKNLLDDEFESGKIDWFTGQNASDASYIRSKNYSPIKGGLTYYFSIKNGSTDGGEGNIFWYDADKNFISATYATNVYPSTLTKIAPDNAAYVRVSPYASYGATYNNDIGINYPATATSYAPYQSSTHSITFPQSATPVYGCEVDWTNGVLKVTKVRYTFKNSDGWIMAGTKSWGTACVDNDIKPNVDNSTVSDIQCDIFSASSPNGVWLGTNNNTISITTSSNVHRIRIYNADLVDKTASEVAEFMTGKTIVYPLATPIEIPLTPEVITLLQGENNIYTDSGTTTLTYQPNNMVGELKGQIQDLQEQINILITQLNNLS